MIFPTPHTIQRRQYVSGAEDAHGNPVDGWADPVDVAVYGWAVPRSLEPKLAGRDALTVDLEVYGPVSAVFGRRDKAVVNGAEYDVVGEPEDFTHGPFGWEPGIVVNLHRAEG